MMNAKHNECQTVQAKFDTYLAGDLWPSDTQRMQKHVECCDACHSALTAHQAYLEAMAALSFEPASPNFDRDVFSAARKAAKNKGETTSGRRGFIIGFSSALAASFAAFVVLFTILMPAPQSMDSVAVVSIAENMPLRLVIQASSNVQIASVTIELPEGVELAGYEGLRTLQWQTGLQQGANVLSLPLRALGDMHGELVAKIVIDGKERLMRVRLKPAQGDDVSTSQVMSI